MRYSIDEPYVKFNGDNGWIKVTYPNKLEASKSELVTFDKPSGKIDYSGTLSDKADFLKSIMENKPSLQPIEVGHNVYFTTLMGLIAVVIGKELTWNNDTQQFVDDTAANTMLLRPFREKWLDRNVVDWMNKYQQVVLK